MSQSALDFCKEVQQKKKWWEKGLDVLKATTPIGLIEGALDKVGSRNKSTSTSVTSIKNSVSQKTQTLMDQACINDTIVKQLNSLDNTACLKELKCGDMAQETIELTRLGLSNSIIEKVLNEKAELCKKVLSGKKVQSNVYNGKNICALENAVKLLSEAKLDSDTMALYQKLQESKGLLASNETKSKNCTDIRNDISSEKYVQSYQKCSNALKLDQTNIAACIGDVDQSNLAAQFDQCMMGQGVIDESKADLKAKTTVIASESQKAEGLDLTAILKVLVIAFVIALLFYVLFIRNKNNKSNSNSTE